jgi:hypothetical protein
MTGVIFQAEYRLRGFKAPQRKFANGHKFGWKTFGELVGGQNCVTQFAGQLFNARGEIYCGPDAGKIEPMLTADVSVQDLQALQLIGHHGAATSTASAI